jgi:DNA repair ATPase RecN
MVMKSVQDGRTGTTLTTVSGTERVEEIARMLGGVTDSAKAHACTLLEESLVKKGNGRSEKMRKA